MKIEFNSEAYWVTLWALIATVIITITVTIGIVDIVNVDRFTSRGYTRATLPGDSYSRWVKASNDITFHNYPQAVPPAVDCSRLAKEAK